jgi:hypothetical protein
MAGTLVAMLAAAPLLAPPGPALTEALAIEKARGLVRAEKDLEDAELTVERAVPATWSDGSLGCAPKGARSLPVVTAGYRVLVRAGGKTHDVRVSADRVLLCEKEGSHRPASIEEDLRAGAVLQDRARKELAARLGVPATEVKVDTLERTTWPDRSLGCPEPGMAYAQVLTPGFVIRLQHEGRSYTYHADATRVVSCGP